MVYAGDAQFVSLLGDFIRQGAGGPTMVAVSPRKIDLLRGTLGSDADHVSFVDMDVLGSNPARILPAWDEFVQAHEPGTSLRGVGEPIWPGRTEAELDECHLHECLLNVAFDAVPDFTLVCPYDSSQLDPAVIGLVRRHHPVVRGSAEPNDEYVGRAGALEILTQPLPPPPADAAQLRFASGPLNGFRRFVDERASAAGLSRARVHDAVLAANELATNSIRHGGGSGVAYTWHDRRSFSCEVRDNGHITDPIVGRLRPSAAGVDGRGLWMANQLCDLVQVRSTPDGTAIRLHMRLDAPP
jgi:anti-sigma regulatory factor (Ser/Thr protein kinase)